MKRIAIGSGIGAVLVGIFLIAGGTCDLCNRGVMIYEKTTLEVPCEGGGICNVISAHGDEVQALRIVMNRDVQSNEKMTREQLRCAESGDCFGYDAYVKSLVGR